jgi:hypothetical protein
MNIFSTTIKQDNLKQEVGSNKILKVKIYQFLIRLNSLIFRVINLLQNKELSFKPKQLLLVKFNNNSSFKANRLSITIILQEVLD